MGSTFKTTRRDQDLDMELEVKLQKPKRKQEEKIKLNRKSGRELSDDKLYTINFSRWTFLDRQYKLKTTKLQLQLSRVSP